MKNKTVPWKKIAFQLPKFIKIAVKKIQEKETFN